jgi:hypothetical protein
MTMNTKLLWVSIVAISIIAVTLYKKDSVLSYVPGTHAWDARKLFTEIGNQFNNENFPSDELLNAFFVKIEGNKTDIINRPIDGQWSMLFKSLLIITNTWNTKLNGTAQDLAWVNDHLNRIPLMLYEHGARLTDKEKKFFTKEITALAQYIREKNPALLGEFGKFTTLLENVGANSITVNVNP